MTKMTNKLIVLLTLVCGCVYSTGNEPPREINRDHSKDTTWQAPKDDTNWIVSPGWHDGKNFVITQSLKPNTITKEKSDGNNDNNSH